MSEYNQPVPVRKLPREQLTPEEIESKQLRDIHQQMVNRCTKPSHCQYKNYGGRGIRVCDRWIGKEGFRSFCQDMGPRPAKHSLDRKENDGDYCPENCRWADHKTQQRNKRNSRRLKNGLTIAEAAERCGMTRKRLRERLEAGWNEDLAVNCPLGGFRVKVERLRTPQKEYAVFRDADLQGKGKLNGFLFVTPTTIGYALVQIYAKQLLVSWFVNSSLLSHAEPLKWSCPNNVDYDAMEISHVQDRVEAIARDVKTQILSGQYSINLDGIKQLESGT
jgi:hypothetical protein